MSTYECGREGRRAAAGMSARQWGRCGDACSTLCAPHSDGGGGWQRAHCVRKRRADGRVDVIDGSRKDAGGDAQMMAPWTATDTIDGAISLLCSDAVINQMTPVWGVDEEGELNGSYRPSGHPGPMRTFYFARALNSKSYRFCTLTFMIIGFTRQLWYAGGYFNISRFYSKQLV
ncbi:hypothetical protein C8R44DRAFT_741471 [Mycena epipterygia]|nr:hypothetical protein C8R44DRAFT_741471 [Mycena epipterygia]